MADSRNEPCRLFAILFLLIMSAATLSAQTRPDSIIVSQISTKDSIVRKDNIIQKIIRYFERSNKDSITDHPRFSFIGGPHYSSDTKFGIGLLAAGLYTTDTSQDSLQPSNITLFADITTGRYFKLGVEGLHLYKHNTRRIDYELFFNSYSTYYWGIGVDNGSCKDNKTKYLLLNFDFRVNHLWRIFNNVYLGPEMEIGHTSAGHIRNPEMWSSQPTKATILSLGGKLQWDTRDNYTFPTSGLSGVISINYNQGLTSSFDKGYYSIAFNVCHYTPLWRGGILASRLHGDFTFGNTPWCEMPTLGASATMRGYYEGQYRDKREMDATVELRQHLLRRSGIVVWGGIGSVFPSFGSFHGRYLLPTYGLGYRWEFKKNTNVRIDVGFGKKCMGIEFDIGEAF